MYVLAWCIVTNERVALHSQCDNSRVAVAHHFKAFSGFFQGFPLLNTRLNEVQIH